MSIPYDSYVRRTEGACLPPPTCPTANSAAGHEAQPYEWVPSHAFILLGMASVHSVQFQGRGQAPSLRFTLSFKRPSRTEGVYLPPPIFLFTSSAEGNKYCSLCSQHHDPFPTIGMASVHSVQFILLIKRPSRTEGVHLPPPICLNHNRFVHVVRNGQCPFLTICSIL